MRFQMISSLFFFKLIIINSQAIFWKWMASRHDRETSWCCNSHLVASNKFLKTWYHYYREIPQSRFVSLMLFNRVNTSWTCVDESFPISQSLHIKAEQTFSCAFLCIPHSLHAASWQFAPTCKRAFHLRREHLCDSPTGKWCHRFAAMLLCTVSAACCSDTSAKSRAHFLEARYLLVKSTEGDPTARSRSREACKPVRTIRTQHSWTDLIFRAGLILN